MLIDNLVGGFPSHITGQMKEDVDILIQKNILIPKPTKHGRAVFINLDYKRQIERALRRNFSF